MMNPSNTKDTKLAFALLVASSLLNCISCYDSFKLLKDAVASSRTGSVRKILERGIKPDDQYFNEGTR